MQTASNSSIRALFVFLLAFFFSHSARSFQTIYNFQIGPRNPQAGLVFGSDGNLYGTAYAGGPYGYGAVFCLTNGAGFTNLAYADFTGVAPTNPIFLGFTNGANPAAPLVSGTSNFLFGTTYQGGVSNFGTVFMTTTNGLLTNTISFDLTNGAFPLGGLLSDGSNNLFGTTYQGGTTAAGTFRGFGTVFKIAIKQITNCTLTPLVNLAFTNGANPQGALTWGRDTNIYGTTTGGGITSNGTVFVMTPAGSLTTLAIFNFVNGATPCGGLVEISNVFYGTTSSGGSSSNGTVFSVTTNGNITTLFSFNGFDGSNPQAGLTLGPDGYLYGTTFSGGAFGNGTLFKITTNGTLTTLVSFDSINGANPQGVLVQTNGYFYGTTAAGGPAGTGAAFVLTTKGEFAPIYYFNPGAGFPSAGLLAGSGGILYGPTSYGGPSNTGTIFGMDPAGQLSLLIPFNSQNSANPDDNLTQDAYGYIYGTTYGGGTGSNSSSGTVFRIVPPGILTNLASFTVTNGAHPQGGVWETIVTNATNILMTNFVTNGMVIMTNITTNLSNIFFTNFYGTTTQGGPTGTGTIYKIAASPTNAASFTITTVAPFVDYVLDEGLFPEGSLLGVAGSNFYGTTVAGGLFNYGTIFEVMTNGALITLHSFEYSDGANPQSALIQGSDGNLYGATSSGGSNGYGTVFQFDPTNSTFNSLWSFSGIDGANPQGPLTQAPDGSLYGTAFAGGTSNYGTIFCIKNMGNSIWSNIPVLSFVSNNGAYPNGGLAQGADGRLYGTTSQGGSWAAGTVFALGTVLSISLTNSNQVVVSWPNDVPGFQLYSTTNLKTTNWIFLSSGQTNLSVSAYTNADLETPQFYRLFNSNSILTFQ